MEEDRKTNKERRKEVKRYKDGEKNKRTQRKSGWAIQREKQHEFSNILLPAMIECMVRSLT